MYDECRDYLKGKIASSGIKTAIHTNQKTLDNDNESHKAAVITDADEFEPSSEKVTYRDDDGKKHKRIKTFDRKLTFIVTIGEYSYSKVEKIFERFVSLLDGGLYIDDNYVKLKLLPANWFDEEDKIIKSKAAIVFKVCFEGCVFEDSDFLKIGIAFEAPEMEGKEEI